MQHHVQCIKRLCWPVQREVPPHGGHSLLQLVVFPGWHRLQDGLDLRDLLHRYLHREPAPVQDVAEGQRVVVGDYDGDAPDLDCLDDPWASHLEPAGAQAELGLAHESGVALPLGEVLVDLHLAVLVLPVLKESLPDVTVGAASEERQDRPLARAIAAGRMPRNRMWIHIKFGQRNIPAGPESLAGVGIAEHSYEVLVQLRVLMRNLRRLRVQHFG